MDMDFTCSLFWPLDEPLDNQQRFKRKMSIYETLEIQPTTKVLQFTDRWLHVQTRVASF